MFVSFYVFVISVDFLKVLLQCYYIMLLFFPIIVFTCFVLLQLRWDLPHKDQKGVVKKIHLMAALPPPPRRNKNNNV